ncbi:MAG: HlyD family type I secretion periplasmic adaptor subunit [Rhizobium sp.]|nr:HlyD family type I secretion periplasmic adaptor subunit [Rhizobium sp.]
MTPPRKPETPRQKLQRTRGETEFRPAALEILEQPQSPVRAAVIWVICAFALFALAWSYIGTFDIVATAQGKLQPRGRVKVIQSIETGKTLSVLVSNGTPVRQGQVLVELDPTDPGAELQAILGKLSALQAAITRRTASLETLERWTIERVWLSDMAIDASLNFAAGTPDHVARREYAAYSSEMKELAAQLHNLKAQRLQQQAALNRLEKMLVTQSALIETLRQRVTMRQGLADTQAGTKAVLLDAVEAQQQELATLVELEGQQGEVRAAHDAVNTEADKTMASFVAATHREQVEAFEQQEELEQQRIRAANRLKAMIITSPIDGVVQASALTTPGQVISAGTEIMRIVPSDAPLEVEAYLPNRDIGFVAVGQPAVLKIEAFPFTRYGTIEGVVTAVGRDAIPEPDAQRLEGQPSQGLQSMVPTGNAQRMQNLVFPVTVKPDVTTIEVNGTDVPLSPGMSVAVEVKTGQRRIIEYLFSPISEVTSEAMRER